MQNSSRRDFIKLGPAGACLLSAARLYGKTDYTRNLGAQLFTVRGLIHKDPAGTLKAIAAIGYPEVETDGQALDKLGPMIKDAGLRVACADYLIGSVIDGRWSAAVEKTKEQGIQFMAVPWMDEKYRSERAFAPIAEELNKAGEMCKVAGIRLAYHHHNFEFDPANGKRFIDMFIERTDKDLVGLESDVFWASVAGVDPVELLKQHRGRVPIVHLKDKAADAPHTYVVRVPPSAFKEVGNGVLDMPKILKTGIKTGVQRFIVEQDQCPGNPLDSLRQSFEYIRKLSP